MSEMTHLADRPAPEDTPRRDRPMPGAGVLVRNEARKTVHRRAFQAGLLFFLLFVFVSVYGSFHRAVTEDPAAFRLPDAWRQITLGIAPLTGLVSATVLALLIGSEWTWKTARQNVIDGLSREQWFVGKLLLLFMLAGVFLGGQVLLAGGMAAWNSDPGAGPLLRPVDLLMIAGTAVIVVGFLSMGFVASFLTRSAGAGVGLLFLWIFAEQLIATMLRSREDWRSTVADHLPQSLMEPLGMAAQYDLEVRRRLVESLERAGRPVPSFRDTPEAFALVAAWIAAFVLVAWLAHRRRDL